MNMKRIAFTLVEVLIVVIVLGILAAIVVPQFTNATTDANLTSLKTNLQIIHGQLQLYKIQHGDTFPNAPTGTPTFAAQMTGTTNASGATGTGASYPFGPYLQSIPNNPYTGTNTVGATADYSTAWYYDSTTGTFKANDSAAHAAY
jgi:general secretion pathway protein G